MLAVGIVGMAQVAARAWFTVGTMPKEQAVDVITGLAWKGLRGFLTDDAKAELTSSD